MNEVRNVQTLQDSLAKAFENLGKSSDPAMVPRAIALCKLASAIIAASKVQLEAYAAANIEPNSKNMPFLISHALVDD